jgi:transposase
MLGVSITPANVQDRDGFLPLLKEVRRLFVFLKRLFADGGYSGDNTRAAAKRVGKVELEIVKRPDAAKGFIVLPKRWIVTACTMLPVWALSGRRLSNAGAADGDRCCLR